MLWPVTDIFAQSEVNIFDIVCWYFYHRGLYFVLPNSKPKLHKKKTTDKMLLIFSHTFISP